MKIVVDAMGGDFAPKVNVDGAIDALREYPDMDIILVGPQALVEETISAYGDAEALGRVRERLTVVDAPEVITTEEHPVMAAPQEKFHLRRRHGHRPPQGGAGVCLRRFDRRADGGRDVQNRPHQRH